MVDARFHARAGEHEDLPGARQLHGLIGDEELKLADGRGAARLGLGLQQQFKARARRSGGGGGGRSGRSRRRYLNDIVLVAGLSHLAL